MVEIVILVVVSCALYGRSIGYDLVVDEVDMHRRRDLRLRERFYGAAMFSDKRADRIATILLHTVVSAMVWVSFGMTDVAFMAALLFLVHPVNNQCAVWMNGKRYAFNALIVLLVNWWPAMVPLLVLCPFLQVSAVVAPFVLAAKNPLFLFATPVVLLFVIGYLDRFKGKCTNLGSKKLYTVSPDKIAIYVKTIGYYLAHCLFPRNIFMWHPFLFTLHVNKDDTHHYYRPAGFSFIVGVISIIATLLLIVLNLDNNIGYGLLWWLLFISVFGNIVTVTQNIADRYCYLPLIGLMVAVAMALKSFGILPAGYLLAVYYATKTDTFIPMYRDMKAFLLHHTFYAPGCPRPWLYLSNRSLGANLAPNGFYFATEGNYHNPRDGKLMFQVANCLFLLGDPGAAKQYYEMARRHIPEGFEQEMGREIDSAVDACDRQIAAVAEINRKVSNGPNKKTAR
jgi:hypothetical protein